MDRQKFGYIDLLRRKSGRSLSTEKMSAGSRRVTQTTIPVVLMPQKKLSTQVHPNAPFTRLFPAYQHTLGAVFVQ